jgi:CheY-like chemotaxis protein
MARILLVEDDPRLRDTLAVALGEAGHEVLSAADGGQAATLLRAGAAPDLALTDLFMPGRDGFETLALLRRDHPAVPVIVMSGSEHGPIYLKTAAKLGACRVLAKPFELAGLLGAVAECLAVPVTTASPP